MLRIFTYYLSFAAFLPLLVSGALADEGQKSAQIKRLEWKVLQEEAGYRAAQNELSKFNLLFAYENLAQAVCMPSFHKSLQFAGKPESEPCLEVLKKIEGLGEPSIVAVCIQEGFGSPLCKEGYAHQLALPRSSLPARHFDPEEGQGRYSGSEPLPAAFIKEKKLFQAKKDLTHLKKMTGAIRPSITEACDSVTIRLVHESDLPLSRDQYFQENSKEDKVDNLLKELTGDPKNEGAFADLPAKKDDRVRIRVLGDRCVQLLEAMLAVHPLSSLAICERDGAYSHNCATAIVQERRYVKELKRKPNPTSQSVPSRKGQSQEQTEGFSTF